MNFAILTRNARFGNLTCDFWRKSRTTCSELDVPVDF